MTYSMPDPVVHHVGRGRQVISVCKSADLLLMVLDASKPTGHKEVVKYGDGRVALIGALLASGPHAFSTRTSSISNIFGV